MKQRLSFKEFLQILEKKAGEFRRVWPVERDAPEPPDPDYEKRRNKWRAVLGKFISAGLAGNENTARLWKEIRRLFPFRTAEGPKAFKLTDEITDLILAGDRRRLKPNQRDEYIKFLRRCQRQTPEIFIFRPEAIEFCLKRQLAERQRAKKRAGQ